MMKPVGSNRSKIRSGRQCYRCLRNELLSGGIATAERLRAQIAHEIGALMRVQLITSEIGKVWVSFTSPSKLAVGYGVN